MLNPGSAFEGLPSLFNPLNDTLMVLIGAMALGFVQVITGMIVSFVKKTKDGHLKDGLMDEGSWWLVFVGIALGALGVTWWVLIAGAAALLLTQGRSSPTLLGKFVGGIASFYSITGYFGDILSYSRLMALMLAGSVIGQVFNTLGAITGNIVTFTLIFLVGHTLNFGLSLLGCFVHDMRLQCLEFFGKFYSDGGRPFEPLEISTKYVNIITQGGK
jgi:V/A-type H+/Na+-transporting ATPase subunit I